MINDQAAELRALIQRVRADERRPADAPRLIVVSGGAPDVGATAIAANLALALATSGKQTVLVDADLDEAAATTLCGATGGPTIVDVLADQIGVADALCETQHGLRVLPGLWGSGLILNHSPAMLSRLIEQLQSLERVDCVVIDVGSARSHVVSDFWHAADLVLVVAMPTSESLVSAYSAIKVFGRGCERKDVRLIVNRADGAGTAEAISARLSASAERFLQRGVPLAAWLPRDSHVERAGREQTLFLTRDSASPASQALAQLASRIGAEVEFTRRELAAA